MLLNGQSCGSTFLLIVGFGLITNEVVSSIQMYPTAVNVRLANGTSNEGRLEVFHDGQWGTVCSDGFDNREVMVACQMLGFSAMGVSLGNQHGSGTGQIWLDDLQCTGQETSLESCSHNGWGIQNCTHNQDISIGCSLDYNCSETLIACDAIMRIEVDQDFFVYISRGQMSPAELSSHCINWSGCITTANSGKCSLSELNERLSQDYWYYSNEYPTYAGYYSEHAIDSWNVTCTYMNINYVDYYTCFNNNGYNSIIESCNDRQYKIEEVAVISPYYMYESFNYSSYHRGATKCFFVTTNGTCSYEIAQMYAAYYCELLELWDGNYCSYSMNDLLNSTKPSCDPDEVFLCSWLIRDQLSTIADIYYDLTHYETGYYFNIDAFSCSNWTSSMQCASSKTRCTFDEILTYTESVRNNTIPGIQGTIYYFRRNYNATFDSFLHLCSPRGQELLNTQCTNCTEECDRMSNIRNQYPYFHRNYTCRVHYEDGHCAYDSATKACNKSAASSTLELRLDFDETWAYYFWTWDYWFYKDSPPESDQCGYSVTEIENIPYNRTLCDRDSHFLCIDKTQIFLHLYVDGYLEEFLSGNFDETFSTRCSYWDRFVQCLNCNDHDAFFDEVEFVDAYVVYNYIPELDPVPEKEHREHILSESLTGPRLQKMCESDRNETEQYGACLSEYDSIYYGGFYRVYRNCKPDESGGPFVDTCSYYEQWFRCLYIAVEDYCSADTGAFVMDYLLREWTTYLLERHSCLLDMNRILNFTKSGTHKMERTCDGTACVLPLASSASDMLHRFKTGRLTSEDLSSMCMYTHRAYACVTNNHENDCIMKGIMRKYKSLELDAAPYFCDSSNQQDYLENQQCYSHHSAATEANLNQFFVNSVADCPSKRHWLIFVYESVVSACDEKTAAAVVGLASRLQSILDLSSTTDCSCHNPLVPSENELPLFDGPYFGKNKRHCEHGSCRDAYFVCRIKYNRQETDDGARFDVSLMFNGHLAKSYKTTTSLELDVKFTARELVGYMGTQVTCAVRSYWEHMPTVKSKFVMSKRSHFTSLRH